MQEFSVILKNNVATTVEEFRILDNYAHPGVQLYVIERQHINKPYTIKHRALEYIFDTESLMRFYIISDNVLAKWDANITKSLFPGDEYMIADALFVTPYYPRTIDLYNF